MSSVETSTVHSPAGSSDEIALFHRTLAELCRADVPLPKAFHLLQGDVRRGKLRQAVQEMSLEVQRGVPLSEAYTQRMGDLPALYRALIEIGVVSGDLPGVLDEISLHAAQRASIAQRFRAALAYPVVAACFVIAGGAFLAGYVAPSLWQFPIAVELGSPLLYAQGALGVLVLLTLGALFFGWVRGPIDGSGRGAFHLPVVGRLRLLAAKAAAASTLALVLRRNVPLPAALSLAAESADNKGVRNRLRAMAKKALGGAALSEVLREDRTFDPTLVWLIESGESAGDAPGALAEVGEIYRDRLGRAVERVTTLVTPLAELVIGAVVFAFAYTFLVPLFEYSSRLFSL